MNIEQLAQILPARGKENDQFAELLPATNVSLCDKQQRENATNSRVHLISDNAILVTTVPIDNPT